MPIEPEKVDYSDYAYNKKKDKIRRMNSENDLSMDKKMKITDTKEQKKDNITETNDDFSHIIIDERKTKDKKKSKKTKKQNIYDKKINKRDSGGFKFLVLILVTVVILLICITAITIKKISDRASVNADGSMKYYAVEMYVSPDYNSSHVYASELRKQGGGGFVIKKGNDFSVLASCYASEKDAEKVAAKLITEGNQCKIIVLVAPYYVQKDYGVDYNVYFDEAMTYCDMIYKNLFEISNNLDLRKIGEQEAQNKVLMIMERTSQMKKKLNSIDLKKQDARITALKVEMDVAVGIMESLTNSELTRPNLLCDIRYTYLVIINNYIALVKSFVVV